METSDSSYPFSESTDPSAMTPMDHDVLALQGRAENWAKNRSRDPQNGHQRQNNYICIRCYNRGTPQRPSHSPPDCPVNTRTEEGKGIVIRNFEAFLRAKNVLNDNTYQLTGPMQDALPPAGADPTVNHVVPRVLRRPEPGQAQASNPQDPMKEILILHAEFDENGNELDRGYRSPPETNAAPAVQPAAAFTLTSNYKVRGRFAVHRNEAFETNIILDTGAGPNCVALDALPEGWEKFASSKPDVSLRAANGRSVSTKGYVSLFIQLGEHLFKQDFLVCASLPVSIILGTQFLDARLKAIDSQEQRLVLKDKSYLPIARDVATLATLSEPVGPLTPKHTVTAPNT